MNRIEFGDCRDTMRRWAGQGVRVQTCVTSPPYFGLRDYGVDGQIGLEQTPEEYIAAMVEVFRCVRDVLADDGTLWVNIGDSYAGAGYSNHKGTGGAQREDGGKQRHLSGTGYKNKDLIGIPWMLALALRADGWYLRQDIIWHKPNPMPESVRDRCTKAHEYIFLMSKSDRYFFDGEAIKEPAVSEKPAGNKRHKYADAYADGTSEEHRTKAGLVALAGVEWKIRNRRSVWSVESTANRERECLQILGSNLSTSDKWEAIKEMMGGAQTDVWKVATRPYKGAHFATFPPALIEPCILAGSRPGDIVLDPFMGSGTTAAVALQHDRQYLGCELNPEYGPLQQERVQSVVEQKIQRVKSVRSRIAAAAKPAPATNPVPQTRDLFEAVL